MFEALKGVFADATQYVNDKRKAWATYRLEQTLADCLEKAEGHKAAGAKPGDEAFKSLNRTAAQAITKFSAAWEADPEEVRAQVPGLRTLEHLIVPQPEPNRMAQGAIVVALVVLVVIAIGAILGIGAASYHEVLHLLGW